MKPLEEMIQAAKNESWVNTEEMLRYAQNYECNSPEKAAYIDAWLVFLKDYYKEFKLMAECVQSAAATIKAKKEEWERHPSTNNLESLGDL